MPLGLDLRASAISVGKTTPEIQGGNARAGCSARRTVRFCGDEAVLPGSVYSVCEPPSQLPVSSRWRQELGWTRPGVSGGLPMIGAHTASSTGPGRFGRRSSKGSVCHWASRAGLEPGLIDLLLLALSTMCGVCQ